MNLESCNEKVCLVCSSCAWEFSGSLAQPVLPIPKLTPVLLVWAVLFRSVGSPEDITPGLLMQWFSEENDSPSARTSISPSAIGGVTLSTCPVQNMQQLLTWFLLHNRLFLLGPSTAHRTRRRLGIEEPDFQQTTVIYLDH